MSEIAMQDEDFYEDDQPADDVHGGDVWMVGRDLVGPWLGLRWDDPARLGAPQGHRGCDLHAPHLSSVHLPVPPDMFLLGIYHGVPREAIPRRYILEGRHQRAQGGDGEGPGLGVAMRAVRTYMDAPRAGGGAACLPEVQEPLLGPAAQNPEARPHVVSEQVQFFSNKRAGGRDRTSYHRIQCPALCQ